ncbi:tRNA (adenosine(37)-N6)-threonylcarbamoyltransferase complex dimerization subunit type 1 TsaB [Paucidesulfovibrio longus]|uniref:tRNA (adenosine(37)-N6)-threonylcarbamoyltransferase complex dimerization subunit type 1 TsaB n=1 Tax=Paucidesulfovibrio longus TaxID=889 RepID=UPI0003B35B74|nr:tRNA (adenosine(37)-N6)-threonylcarbamoyltransferase complex dimerization subunit type 1 TsaB [Paucidesulfovibrio longus]
MTFTASSFPDGLTLALNGAEERLQIALGHAGPHGGAHLLAAQEWTVPGESVRFLAPSIKSLLRALGLKPENVSRIACVRGPGSFTGLRLSLAVAAALSAVHGQPMAGIEHLPLLARCVAPLLGGPLAVLTHSRRRQVYVQTFGNDAKPLGPLLSGTLEDAEAHLRELAASHSGPASLLGSGLRRNADFFTPLAEELGMRVLGPQRDAPSPQALLDAACDPDLAYGPSPVEPLYMRPSDAEENLDTIARQRGLDPDVAREMLRRSRES